MPTREELQLLLQTPSESLSIEYKSWLDITEIAGKANLAKAAIALANEGGGIIVLGMREDVADGGALHSQARPAHINRYSLDDINAAIARFTNPEFHCGLVFAPHPESHNEHAFVVVPGGMIVPVMSQRACEGIIEARRCYVRKPGPRSEEPFTAEEWRGVMERSLQARRESMLDAIRRIVLGHGTPQPLAPLGEALDGFANDAREHWTRLLVNLPADDDARMPRGYYELEFELLDVRDAGDFAELRRRMREAGHIRHTGWGPFVSLNRLEFAPQPVEGSIQVWLGRPVEGVFHRSPAHCDFWRASPRGLFFSSAVMTKIRVIALRPVRCLMLSYPFGALVKRCYI